MVMDMSESKAAFQVKTGPVRVSGYAIKLRKAINGVLSDYYKQGKCSSKAINERRSMRLMTINIKFLRRLLKITCWILMLKIIRLSLKIS